VTFPYEGENEPAPGRGVASGLSATELGGRGRVVLLEMLDPGGFRAVLVPAHGTVLLHGLEIDAWWPNRHDTAQLDVIVARDVAIDGKPIESFVTGNVASDAGAEASATAGHHTPLAVDPLVTGVKGRPISFAEDCRASARAVLTR
jgi:hypothetical protein